MYLLLFLTATLQAPQQISPAAGVTLRELPREVTLEWSTVDGAESYVLQVDCMCCMGSHWCADVGGRTISTRRGVLGTKYTLDYSEDKTYRWRVWAVTGSVEGEKSSWRVFSFDTAGAPEPPKAPFPLMARGISQEFRLDVTLMWSPVAGAERYFVELDFPDTGKSMIVETKDRTYLYAYPGHEVVRWRVWAIVNGHRSEKSPWVDLTARSPDADGVYKVGGGVKPPIPTSKVEPEMSVALRGAKITATVVIGCIIDIDGNVRNPQVVKSSGYDVDENAMTAVRQWKFKPATKEDQPVPVHITIEFTMRPF